MSRAGRINLALTDYDGVMTGRYRCKAHAAYIKYNIIPGAICAGKCKIVPTSGRGLHDLCANQSSGSNNNNNILLLSDVASTE